MLPRTSCSASSPGSSQKSSSALAAPASLRARCDKPAACSHCATHRRSAAAAEACCGAPSSDCTAPLHAAASSVGAAGVGGKAAAGAGASGRKIASAEADARSVRPVL